MPDVVVSRISWNTGARRSTGCRDAQPARVCLLIVEKWRAGA
ncbi:hypothetical protein BDSB_20965 [Burkholderia dolosa PC543]|nr:hypothetical protein BDSB_20965 [Burkholderia dolosa PC543]